MLQIITCTLHAAPYLFQHYPQLAQQVPYVELCDLPTPIVHLEKLGNHIGCPSLYMKQDGLSGKKMNNGIRSYGGNKPRKLEFLFGKAIQEGAQKVATFGCVGSNHAAATAAHAHVLGLPSTLLLLNQPNSHVVRNNLLLDDYHGAQLLFFSDVISRAAGKDTILAEHPDTYFIPTGGSNAVGALGYVNAAFELADQVDAGILPAPDYIYVAAGSCGTVAGLALGLRLAGLSSKVVAVTVFPERVPNTFLNTIQNLFTDTASLLHQLDKSIPLLTFSEDNLIINTQFCGTRYGLYTETDKATITQLNDLEHVTLEGTYTAKPAAALIHDGLAGNLQDKTILFWNTYCSIDYSDLIKETDYKSLPTEFHQYFEQEVQ